MPAPSWKDSYYTKIHELAKSGMTELQIARTLGVCQKTFKQWKKRRPAIQESLTNAKTAKLRGSEETFREYVYKRLPPDLQNLWDEIAECNTLPNGILRAEALLKNAGKQARQHLFIHALTAYNFNASRACRAVNISKPTLQNWINFEPRFAQLLDEIHWHKENFFEDALIGLVNKGDSAATIFAARTFLRNRGYGEKMTVDHTGSVNHTQTIVKVDTLKLPLETRKQMLNAIREQRALPAPIPPPEAYEEAEWEEQDVSELEDSDDEPEGIDD